MRSRSSRFILAAVALAVAQPASQAAAPAVRDVTADFVVPDGLQVTLWAETPMFFNPTNIDVDARGRVWVAEGVNYRHKEDKPGYLKHPRGDRIMILEDTDGDGAADRSKVFVEDADLTAPLGVTVLGNKVYVPCSPNLFVFTDLDGDDHPDRKEVFLNGFSGRNSDHGLHALIPGADGRLYVNVGNGGRHWVSDRDGWTVRIGALFEPTVREKADDGRTYVEGLVLRLGADGRGMEVFGHNFRNAYETTVDSFGNVWNNDNDDDGFAATRVAYVVRGGNHGYASADGNRRWQADQRPGQKAIDAHWHRDDPGVIPSTEIVGAGSPAGFTIYEGNLLPARFRGSLLNAEAGHSAVLAHTITPVGAGFVTTHTALVAARDGADGRGHSFRPSDVAVAADGSVFVADWYDTAVGGDAMNDQRGYGRIFRIAPRGATRRLPTFDLAKRDDQVRAFLSPAPSLRWQAADRLVQAGAEALPAVDKLLGAPDPRVRARAVFVAARLGAVGRSRVDKALGDRDPSIRLTALRGLRLHAGQDDVLAAAKRLVTDASPAVRRELALFLRDLPAEHALPLWLTLASSYRTGDRVLLEALGIGAERREEQAFAALAARDRSAATPLSWTPALADLVWRLHPDSAVDALLARARASGLPRPAREQALTTLAFIPGARGAQAMVALASEGPADNRPLALHWLNHNSQSSWKAHGVGDALAALGRAADPDTDKRRALERDVSDNEAAAEKRIAAAKALAATPKGGVFLMGLAQQKKLTPELKAAIAEVIFANPDLSVRAMASEHFERPAFDGVAFPPLGDLMKMRGDPARGRQVFFGPTAACSRCHLYGGQGQSVGPDLTMIGAKFGKDGLFDAILNPSAGIAFGYEPWVVTTKREESFSGFLVGDGETVILKEVSGEQRLIPAKDVASRQRSTISLMPDNIALGMKPQDLVDLVAFLQAGGKPPTAASAASR